FPACELEFQAAKIVSAYTLYTVRGLIRGQSMFGRLALDSRPELVARFGEGFATRLDVLLDNRAPKCSFTGDVLQLADAIVDVLEDEESKAKEQSKADSDDSKGGDSKQSDQAGANDQQGNADGDDQAGSGQGGDQSA